MAPALFAAAALYVIAAWFRFDAGDGWLGSKSYPIVAANLLNGFGYTSDRVHPTAQRPPGYPVILMETMRVSGKHWFAATIVLQALGAVACLALVFEIAGILWPGSPARWLAIGLLLLHGPFMFEMLSLRETVWFTLGLVGVARLLLRPASGVAGAAAMGIALAAVYLLRPTGLMAALVTLPFLIWEARTARCARILAVTGIVFFYVLVTWEIYTWRAFGAPGFFPSSLAGYNLCKGAMPETASIFPWIDPDVMDVRMRRLVATIPIGDESRIDARFKRIAWTLVRENPGAAMHRSLLNALAFVSPLPVPLGSGTLLRSGPGWRVDNFKFYWSDVPFAPLILVILAAGVLGLFDLAAVGGGARRVALWIGALCLVFLGVHALTFVKTRYRLPLDALLVIPAAGWLAQRLPRRFRAPAIGKGSGEEP